MDNSRDATPAADDTPRLSDYAAAALQYAYPKHLLSAIMYRIARLRIPLFKNALIGWFAARYRVDMSIAADPDLRSHPDFSSFFTRPLASGARPLAPPGQVVSPADGQVSQLGVLDGDRLIQAKGRDFSVHTLLGDDPELAAPFANGQFATVYLSPRDYHRVHMPVDGTLTDMVHVPGALFSVNHATARVVPGLFARNERVAMLFDTPVGRMALVMVGAVLVGSIETVWSGVVTPPRRTSVRRWRYGPSGEPPVNLGRGEELGRFNMGSTVILVFEPGAVTWRPGLGHGDDLTMGSTMGDVGKT